MSIVAARLGTRRSGQKEHIPRETSPRECAQPQGPPHRSLHLGKHCDSPRVPDTRSRHSDISLRGTRTCPALTAAERGKTRNAALREHAGEATLHGMRSVFATTSKGRSSGQACGVWRGVGSDRRKQRKALTRGYRLRRTRAHDSSCVRCEWSSALNEYPYDWEAERTRKRLSAGTVLKH